MAYTQILIDDFNNGVVDSSRWTIAQGPGATESGGMMNLACVVDYPQVVSKNYFDLSAGILAAKLSTSGTRADATEFYLGVQDVAGNQIMALGAPNGTFLTFAPGGLTTFSEEVITDVTVGVGWDWDEGTWWGVGNMSADNVLRMYNSKDGQTWNEMARCKVGGVLTKTSVAPMFMAGIWNGLTTDLTARFNDASFWLNTETSSRLAKVRVGSSWVDAAPKTRVAGAWNAATPKTLDGAYWRAPR